MAPLKVKPFVKTVGLTSIAVTGLITAMRLLGALEASELRAYDRFLRWRSRSFNVDERVVVVEIDDNDIQDLDEYPIHDETLAKALVKLEALGPRAIGVDIGRDIPQGPEAGRKQMLEVISQSDSVIMACKLSEKNFPGLGPPTGTPDTSVSFAGFPQDSDGVTRRSILISAPVSESVAGSIVRRHFCNDEYVEEIPSLALTTAMMYLEEEGILLEQLENNDIQFNDVQLNNRIRLKRLSEISGGYAWNGAFDYQIMLNYRAAEDAVNTVKFSKVLAGDIDPALIRDRLVLIGYTSPVVKDVLKTPYISTGPRSRSLPLYFVRGLKCSSHSCRGEVNDYGSQREMYGVMIHAQAASQLLSAALDGRPLITTWSEPLEIAWIWLWALTAGTLVFYSRHLSWFSVGAGILVLSCCGIAYGLFIQGLWIPLIPCLWAIVFSAVITGLLDRANRGGYTQAILIHLQEQLNKKESQGGDRQDYLTGLVRRARAVRLQRSGQAIDAHDLAQDPLNLQFDSPEMQDIYDAVVQKAQQDAKASLPSALEQQSHLQRNNMQQRISRLMDKSRAMREPSSNASGETR